MVAAMDEAGFGNCTNYYECSAVCPKLISHDFISKLNRDYLGATVRATFGQSAAVTAGT
jgi:succinate dehydrogenase / fumarate reductase iron-sulfur subunit